MKTTFHTATLAVAMLFVFASASAQNRQYHQDGGGGGGNHQPKVKKNQGNNNQPPANPSSGGNASVPPAAPTAASGSWSKGTGSCPICSLTVSTTAVQGATGYDFEVGHTFDGSLDSDPEVHRSTTSPLLHIGYFEPVDKIFIRVRAKNNVGVSAWTTKIITPPQGCCVK